MSKSPYLLSSYAYDLDDSMIAQVPVLPPESAKLMSVSHNGKQKHGDFFHFPEHLSLGTAIFLNNSKVLPARISWIFSISYRGTVRERTGEVLYLNALEKTDTSTANLFEAMVYPGDYFPIGSIVTLGAFVFEVRAITYQGRIMEMKSDASVLDMMLEYGIYPIPPYIQPSQTAQVQYQTEFAKLPGSLAAPTASLHFTKSLLHRCETVANAKIQYATLHVGIGTFKIINQIDIRNHTMHAETMLITEEIFENIARTKQSWWNILAVWTTMVRYLESLLYLWPLIEMHVNISPESKTWWECRSDEAIRQNHPEFVRDELFRLRSKFQNGIATAETSIFIYPGYHFWIVDEIVTNFHLPNSTLMPMIAAFIGLDRLKEVYETAKANGYRFYSFGDGIHLVCAYSAILKKPPTG